jgi:hypothetical protein
MNSKRWRGRLAYTALSVFLGWHTLALVLAPVPDGSATAQSIRPLFQPYLSLLHLDNKWDFYAPSVGRGRQFRYVIEDSAGKRHTFSPAEELNWFYPDYWWFKAWHDAITDYPEIHGELAAALLCRKHASLHPISITLLGIQEEDFLREDYLGGKRPTDSEFVTENTLTTSECRN